MSPLKIFDCYLTKWLEEQLAASSSEEALRQVSRVDLSCDAGDIFNLIMRLKDQLIQRLDRNVGEPVLLLVFEDLSKVLSDNEELHDAFIWLVFYGPRANVWVITTQSATQPDPIKHWLRKFRFQITPIDLKEDLVPEPVVLSLLN